MNRRGFTLIELVIVITIAGILISFAVKGFSDYQGRTAGREARNTFAALHARARAQAIEFGTTVRLVVRADSNLVRVVRNDTSLEVVRFDSVFGVDLTSNETTTGYVMCMTPRGFANSGCTGGLTTPDTLTFSLGGNDYGVRLLALGQLTLLDSI
jgi:prepilin-type N-terminal cleavage/methylation domain-containing protein